MVKGELPDALDALEALEALAGLDIFSFSPYTCD